jgi:hypothetical protein
LLEESMAFTYVLTTDVGKVRMLIPDRNAAAYFFEDDELTALLAMEGGTVKLAAALALETMASDEAYVQKAIRIMDLSTNGPATAAALMARAKVLREQADQDGSGFDVAEMVINDFAFREHIYNEALRDG